MKFKRSETLCNFDVYPKVFAAGKEAEIHIVNNGYRKEFETGKEYDLAICAQNTGKPVDYPQSANFVNIKVVCDEKGGFTFKHTFTSEQQYTLFIEGVDEDGDKVRLSLDVYCVEGDLIGRYPFMGDLHMHTNCSDGRQDPEVVAANYRSCGYDFLAITDHHRYYPSLRAMNFYKDIPNEFNLVPGEEVHMPKVKGLRPDVHIVNFGGEYSVNGLVEDEFTYEAGKDAKYRSLNGDGPAPLTHEQYEEKICADAEKLNIPDTLPKTSIAVYNWVFSEIRKANGLGIFAHPTWVTGNCFQVPDALNDYLVENKMFDAFEVLGGERYFEQNGYQTVRYYEDKAKGCKYPIVGSTDSHCSYYYNKGAFICSTLVFAKENEKNELIDSIKNFYSAAVDTISEEFRIVGDMRLVRYGCFLLKNYFPIHDEACYEEGRLMRQCYIGTEDEKEDAKKALAAINGRMKKLREKYFCF